MRCCYSCLLLILLNFALADAYLDIRPKRDVVAAVCKRRPDLPYCRGKATAPETIEAPEASEPFPMGIPDKEPIVTGGKPPVKNPFDEISERNVTQTEKKKPQPVIVLDPKNEEELSKIKVVDPRPWNQLNNWGFEHETRDRKRPSKVLMPPPSENIPAVSLSSRNE
ncbi:hypothetical protein L596_000550 [Steinernema carpocapsae]|uniref:Uncharacterized protein n=1 Tax=Steinernema carpocapsae TaxID=34508 RepID=A0A4U8UJ50_STECR|nr:hypothetical protein L596_000550 [Steinernema carpocapsae]